VGQTPGVTRARIGLLTAALLTLLGVVCGVQIWLSMITHGHSLPRVVLFQVLAWNFWLLASLAALALVRRVPLVPVVRANLLVHLLAALVLGVLHAAWTVGLELALRPYDHMNPSRFERPFLEQGFFQMPLEVLLYGLVVSAVLASDAFVRMRERERRASELERLLAEARLHALELQIQPHFLFNTLNAVSALVRTGQPSEAVGMIAGLSDLLRYALDRAGDQRVALADEVAMLERYLDIQRLRFPDRLRFDIAVDDDTRRAAVPVLLLQPLAENAIRHGIAPSPSGGDFGVIRVRAERDASRLRIEIWNSGRLDPAAARRIGLANTVARLEQLYGTEQRFELCAADGGVLARISIPWAEAA
jgi:two-component system LytT family sensor kinase